MLDPVDYERMSLCTTIEALTDAQFAAETLCAGWDAGDVAAHLVAREREPWTTPGLVLGGPFAALTRRRQRRWRAKGRAALERKLRAGPTPWMSAGPMAGAQAVEDWIHHQDIRRGGAGLPRLDPTPALQEQMWEALPRFAKGSVGRIDTDGVIAFTDGDRRVAVRVSRGRRLGSATDAQADATVRGPISELLLYAVGRSVADVSVTGKPDLVAALEESPRSA